MLVATADGTSAARLRAALPAEIAALTALPEPAGDAAGSAVAAALLDRATGHDPRSHARHIADLAEREEGARREVAALRERAAGADGPAGPSGAPGACDLGPGYLGDRAELERRVRAEAADHGWLPSRPGLPDDPPLSGLEAAELVRLLAGETPERQARTAQRDVDPGSLPSAPYVRTLIEAEAAAAERAERSETDLSRRLRGADVTLLARLDGCASVVVAALRDLGLDGHPSGWKPHDLAARAFADALAHRRPHVWARVAEMSAQAEWAERSLDGIRAHHVELPPGDLHYRRLASTAQDLRNYLADGGTLKRGPLRSSAQRQAEPLLAAVTVDGVPPTTPELLDVLFAELMVRMACQELQYVWEAAGVSFPADVPLADRVARFSRAHARLTRIREALPALEETAELLGASGLGVPLTHPLQWHGYVAALESALLGVGVDRAAADLAALLASIGAEDDDPPELREAVDAIAARDAARYGRALAALADGRHDRALQLRCEELLGRVSAVHPDLAYLLAATDGDAVWPARMERWDQAWAWARAAGRLSALPAAPGAGHPAGPPPDLGRRLAEAEARLRDIGTELSAARAWGACLARLASGAADPYEIVPAWIVPLWRVPDVVPPRPDSFDVVIVDGENGAGAEALFVLWLAPRLILAGPPGPRSRPPRPPPAGPDRPPYRPVRDPPGPLHRPRSSTRP
ncbi:hypothetical protein ACFQHO_15425 [Actinomadura yumaensis]|uniref:hypothetical protein n=1 Tax=Actinomadura yumaensis TaxID=111807 RepID=UPI0036222CA0